MYVKDQTTRLRGAQRTGYKLNQVLFAEAE
jgi:hypothetical protein